MPEQNSSGPVIGDGVVTIPGNSDDDKGQIKMAQIDLSENVASHLLTESVGNIQATNNNGRNIANIAMGSLQAGVAKRHNEIDADESRAVSGIMATPIASPTTQGG